LLHGKQSRLPSQDGETIVCWRKVQQIDGTVAVLGFQENGLPFHTRWSRTDRWGQTQSGRGWFTYKLELLLRQQSGKLAPWLFLSAHVQRYGGTELTSANGNRRISILVGANRARKVIEKGEEI